MYLTVNTLDSKAIQARGEFARGLETEVAAVVALVADVDAEKPKHNYPPQSVILNTLADMPLQPSVIVVSGRADGGLHPYWLLAEPFTIRTEADRDRIKRVSKEWQRLLKSKLAPYELDSTFDLVRVLRPIGTTNKKYGSTVSALVFEPDRRFTVEDFERHLPRPEPARPWTPPPSATGGSISERGPLRGHHPGAQSQGRADTTPLSTLRPYWSKDSPSRLPTPCRSSADGTRHARHLGAKASCSTSCSRQTTAPNDRGYLLTDSAVVPTNGTKITRLVLEGAAR